MKRITLAAAAFLALTQSACIVAGGYSGGGGGWFIWPGGLGFILVLVLLYFLFGRRGR